MSPGANPISFKWRHKIQTKSEGYVVRYKARLIAKGFTQEYGIDYGKDICSCGQNGIYSHSYCPCRCSIVATLSDGY